MKRNFVVFDLAKWRDNLNLSQAACARILCTHPRTIREWESKGKTPPLVAKYCTLDDYLQTVVKVLSAQRK